MDGSIHFAAFAPLSREIADLAALSVLRIFFYICFRLELAKPVQELGAASAPLNPQTEADPAFSLHSKAEAKLQARITANGNRSLRLKATNPFAISLLIWFKGTLCNMFCTSGAILVDGVIVEVIVPLLSLLSIVLLPFCFFSNALHLEVGGLVSHLYDVIGPRRNSPCRTLR